MELDQTPRLTLYTLEYPPQTGGVASYLAGLVKASDPRLRVVQAYGSSWLAWIPKIRDDDMRCGVIVSHVLPMGTAALIAKVLGGRSYSVIFHGLDLLCANRSRWKRWLVRIICQHAYLLAVNSQATARILTRFTDREVLVLTPGVEQKMRVSKAEARLQLGIASHERIILAVSRLVPRKGLDVLIEAVSQLSEPARLVIIGQGPDLLRLESLASSLHGAPISPIGDLRNSSSLFLTDVADAKRDLWYAAADVFALPVREEKDDVEGFGIVFLEAALAGLPIVAGRSGGALEAVLDGVTGTLVEPHDPRIVAAAIKTFLDEPGLAAAFGQAGQARAEVDFRWQERGRALEAAYPLVSVIIPVYNRTHLLRATLDSLCRQTYGQIEVIVIDDGSSEDVASIVECYRDQLTLRFERLSSNLGAPAARNHGFDLSQGEYLIFLDADIVLRRDTLELFTRTLREHPGIDVVYSAFRFGWKKFASRSFDAASLRQGNYMHTSSLMRRAAFSRFDEHLKKFQDWDLWLTMVERGSKMLRIPRVLFRIHGGGTMSKWLPSFVHHVLWEKIGWMPAMLKHYREAQAIVKKKHDTPNQTPLAPPPLAKGGGEHDGRIWWFVVIIALELTSAFTFFLPTAQGMVLLATAGAMLVLAYRRPASAASLLLIEYVIGSKGALLRFGGDGLGHGGVSLRIVWFAAFMLGWFGWSIRHKTYRDWVGYAQDRCVYFWLGALLIYAFVRGLLLHNAFVFDDANAWGVWLLLLPALDLAHHEANALRRYVPRALTAALVGMTLKTLALFYLFSHLPNGFWLNTLYVWVRRTGVGELTHALAGTNAWRIFFQSHIYLLPVIIGGCWYAICQPALSRKTWTLWILASAAFIVSLSRSLWMGLVVGLISTGLLVGAHDHRPSYGGIRRMIMAMMVSLALVFALFYAPPRPSGSLTNFFAARTDLSGAAVVSRWTLLPALWEGIKQHPLLGAGFGATITYASHDPRVVATTGGVYTTYAFEWGWLDHWFKFGLLGIPLMSWIVIRLLLCATRSSRTFWIRGTLMTSLIALAVIHMFTPYLNHPLGIVWLIGLEAWLSTERPT